MAGGRRFNRVRGGENNVAGGRQVAVYKEQLL